MEEKKLTGYASIDVPSRQYYDLDIEEKILQDVDKKMYDFIKERNKGFEDNIFYQYFGEKTTFAEFDKKIELYAKALKKYGLNKGDRITICLPNIPETMIYFYACNRIGVTPYLVDPRCTTNRIIDCMNVSNSKLLISVFDIMDKNIKSDLIPCDNIIMITPANEFLESTKKIGKEAKTVKTLYLLKESLYNLKHLLDKDSKIITQQEFIAKSANYGTLNDSEYDPTIAAAIVNTSGTTGNPKGAMESNRGYNITANQIKYIAPNLRRGMTYFGYIPFFSLYGSSVGMHSAASTGIIVDLIPKINLYKFDQIYTNKKPNIVIGVPKLFSMFPESKYINGSDLSFAELLVMGGDKMSPSKLEKINETLKKNNCDKKVTYGYGTTETMMISTTTDKEQTHEIGGCGTLYPGVKVKIINRDTMLEMTYNNEGEIYVSTPTMYMGYVGNQKETENSIYIDPVNKEKYYKTGDKGYMTENGILYHTGRYKRLMKRPDGHQVNSVPIEDAINSCNLVKDCAVVGIRNNYQEEGVIPTAFIELKNPELGKDAIKEIIAQTKSLLPGEREMALAYTIVDHIPYNINGKVDFIALEKIKFEDIDFVILNDPIFEGYFIKNENIEKINLNASSFIKTLRKK